MKATEREAYSPIRHLAWSVWLNHDPARCWMAMFSAFADTSGTKQSPVMVTALLVGSERQWLQFDREWNRMLDRFDIPYIHMKELEHARPPFERFEDEELKNRLYAAALRIVSRRSARAIVKGLVTRAYATVNLDFQLQEFAGSPLGLCAVLCAEQARAWLDSTHPGQPVRYWHERGDTDQGKMWEFSRRWNVPISPLDKIDPVTERWHTGFQAADMVAWEVRRGHHEILTGRREFRASFLAILSRLAAKHGFGYFSEAELREACRRHPAELPIRVAQTDVDRASSPRTSEPE